MAESMADQADRERAERDRRLNDEALKTQRERDAKTEEYLGADEYVLIGSYAQVKVKDDTGAFVVKHFNEGAVFKAEDLDEDNLRHLVDIRFLVPKGADEARFAGPAGTPRPGEPPNVPVVEGTPPVMLAHEERLSRQQAAVERAERDAQAQQQPADGRPRANASKEDWVGYAVSQRAEGQSEDDARAEAQALSRDDLRTRYGG